ncbi:MAG: hypothetical protein L0Z50_38050 [Verrucomicrobiales bacterium]|nr:hypothetical protein [Verrucomicrobiales bacterium]
MKTLKTPSRLQFTLATALFACALSSHAQTWQMILPNPVPGYAPAGLGRDLLINPFTSSSSPTPGLFLGCEKVSWGEDSEIPSILRLTPTDATSSSFIIEPIDGRLATVGRLGYNQGDALYAVGHKNVVILGRNKAQSQSVMTWTVLRSNEDDQGNPNTWLEDDSFQFSSTSKGNKTTTTAYNSRAYGITTDAWGNVYVCGWAFDGQAYHWIIRKKSSAGWATVPVLDAKAADIHSVPYDLCFVPAVGNNPVAAIFAVGIFNDRWTVLRSRDQGASWQPAGEPWPTDGTTASAYDAASDSNGARPGRV